MSFVVDASIAVEYLLRTDLGQRVAMLVDATELFAPELLDAEVLAVVRRECLRGRLPEARAVEALEDLEAWPIERLPNRTLLRRAWCFRQNVSAYDALYLAAAEQCGSPVLTADGPLARAPSLGIVVQSVRI
ncbi:MAG: type II toxin-antitoxin system VapC family toxin [Polyangiaceae bacterium]|nr:type II toxin-antitoxin system VapC family toxin [Polyangiaceae bacterium]